MYEFGATRYLGKCLQVSAGYVYAKSAVPDAHYTPNVADMDRQFFSVGAGYKGKAISVDAAYQYGYAPNRKVSGSIPPISGWIAGQTADGTYKFNSQAVIVTVGLRF